jgi:nitrate reductase assembly molybdenum cofactor insertion protein NarJ
VEKKELEAYKNAGFKVYTNEDPDFFDLMLKKYLESKEEEVEAFVHFIKSKLLENPPATFTYLDKGLALQFADYTRVVFVDQSTVNKDKTSSIEINAPSRQGGPIVFRQVDTSIPITG